MCLLSSSRCIARRQWFSRRKVLHRCARGVRTDNAGMLLGIGNPLLDITIETDNDLLQRYDLPIDGQVLATHKHASLFDELRKNHKPHYRAGGATLNTLRVTQWMLQEEGRTTFVGSVGRDAAASILEQHARAVGVDMCLDVHPESPTGVCVALISGENRTLVTKLGAATDFHHDFFNQSDHQQIIERASHYYIGGFFLTLAPKTVLQVAQHASENSKVLAMNLHAPFACETFADSDLDLVKHIDLLFGNASEFRTLATHLGLACSDVPAIANALYKFPKTNPSIPRVVVITNGKKPTIVSSKDGVFEFPILKVDPSIIKDTNGCGDAFVGGFLSQFMLNRSLENCLLSGNYAAGVKLRYHGCDFPDKKPSVKAVID